MDLCNLESGVRDLEKLGVDMLHIDVIDGYFSPSMPLGLDVIKDLRRITDMPFDVHVMAKENQFFIDELLKLDLQRLCFHCESELHLDRQLNRIKKADVQSGIALSPATPISVLDYVIEKCDFVMLMLINPGFAFDPAEAGISYMIQKIRDCRSFIDAKGLDTSIEVDGRISIEGIPDLVEAGADVLVLGSTSLFSGDKDTEKNIRDIKAAVELGEKRRYSA
jgi:ribulose-phosphate 3-epimerase